jgi:kumamolisin
MHALITSEKIMANISLKGSERASLPGARVLAPAESTERMEVSVIVRRGAAHDMQSRVTSLVAGDRSRKFMTREEFARVHGAAAADFAAVRTFANAHGISVLQEHAARRTVILSGTVAQFCAAFSVRLHQVGHAGGTYRGRTGEIRLPAELDGIVEAVLGLDNRPQATPHFRVRPPLGNVNWRAADPAAVSYTPTQIAELYGFPDGSGEGECVGLIELGGGFRPADLDTYFSGLGVGSPSVVAVSVDHGKNSPTGDGNGPDGEVMLDVEVVGAIAPKAKIAVYFAPNTDAGFLDAITTAVHDTTNKPSVISISWGGPESSWTSQAMTAMDEAFQAAATLGITVCIASGDNGSSDGVTGGGDHVDFPASSSFALACGGTSLRATQTAIDSESVWNDGASGGASGGGISSFFALPTWQKGLSARKAEGQPAPLTMRGVPDVAGDADPETGYDVRVDGTDTVIGGTSAVAPLWAALIARINGINGKPAGFVNPLLYANPKALRDITVGNNGDFDATTGWDACTGLGTPNGKSLAL